jgi:hypothetical protein
LISDAVRQERNARIGCREVPKQLCRMLDVQFGRSRLALDKDIDLAISTNGIVDLFTFLGSYVGRKLGNDFTRVEDVVAERL